MRGGVRVRRGRAAAYRPIWQWPLRSIPHALLTLAVVLAAAAGLGTLSTGPTTDTAASADSSSAGTTSSPPRPATTGSAITPSSTPGPTPSPLPAAAPAAPPPSPAATGPARTDPVGTATSWTAAWLTAHTVTSTQWLAALKPYTTDEYLGLLSSVDPANVPHATAGRPTLVSAKASSATVTVPLGAATLQLSLIHTPAGWLVANTDRA